MSFINKVVLVTGAASGIGEAIALKFAKLSARLALIDKNEALLKKSADNCEKLSKTKVFRVAVDLCKDENVEYMIELTLKEFGKIDVVVNCAGAYRDLSILDPNVIQVYDEMIAVNLRALVSVTTAATPALVKSKGCVVNISSVDAAVILPNSLMYSVSKSGVNHFTKSAALELASYGVRVNSVLPGAVKTNLLLNSHHVVTQEENEKKWKLYQEMSALKRLIKPEECSDLVSFLASEKAIGITGANFLIDSGLALQP
ncbi:unnamed protein product [Diatraea saccharalis]|uniref:Uncharacterized protein n=1 Tax=Diatraea saccharalis TaxID=40085 RepID=A0A9N9R1I0_9NEOP|nr:unnamed protein product [Diatraea saccharalis]